MDSDLLLQSLHSSNLHQKITDRLASDHRVLIDVVHHRTGRLQARSSFTSLNEKDNQVTAANQSLLQPSFEVVWHCHRVWDLSNGPHALDRFKSDQVPRCCPCSYGKVKVDEFGQPLQRADRTAGRMRCSKSLTYNVCFNYGLSMTLTSFRVRIQTFCRPSL